MMRNDSLFIGLVARISLGGFVFTCHKEESTEYGSFSFFFFQTFSFSGWARVQALWCDAAVALALTSCPYLAEANTAQVPRHLQSRAALCETRTVPTLLLLCSLVPLSASGLMALNKTRPCLVQWTYCIISLYHCYTKERQIYFPTFSNNQPPYWSVFQCYFLARCLCFALSWLGLPAWLLHRNRLAL